MGLFCTAVCLQEAMLASTPSTAEAEGLGSALNTELEGGGQ